MAAPRPRLHRPTGLGCLLPVASGVALCYPGRAVVVLTGLPGAGKSTLLRQTRPRGGLVLDPYDATERLPPRLRARAHQALRVPVHALHWAAAIGAVLLARRGVVVHAHGARPALRAALLRAARASGRPAHLIVVRAGPAEALAGQATRKRHVPPRRFSRHLRHHELLDVALAAGTGPASDWDSACVVRRDAARTVVGIVLEG